MTVAQKVDAVAKDVKIVKQAVLGRFQGFLKEMPSTNWVIFTGTLAAMMTGSVYLVVLLLELKVEPIAFAAWLGFLAGWIGFGVRQFRIKRETHDEYSPTAQKERQAREALAQPDRFGDDESG